MVIAPRGQAFIAAVTASLDDFEGRGAAIDARLQQPVEELGEGRAEVLLQRIQPLLQLIGPFEDADLAGEDHPAVGGLPPAGGAQAVAVEHRADQRPVGERDARRAVPRLHQARVELVERAALRVHRGVVLPRLRDHHQHRVGQAAPAQVQQLEHLVERRRVRCPGRADRVEPLEVPGDEVAVQQRLAGPHPVAVAHHGVDLAVVGDEPERVRQRPARERVGGEPGVDHRQGRRDARVHEVYLGRSRDKRSTAEVH